MQHIRQMAVMLAVLLSLAACTACGRKEPAGPAGDESTGQQAIAGSPTTGVSTGNAEATALPETAPEVPEVKEPTVGDYTADGTTVIWLDGEAMEVTGYGAEVSEDGSTVTITRAGVYVLSGTRADGQVVVDTTDSTKVTLVLNGASLSSTKGPAIFVRSAPKKVVLYTAAGSVNLLSDGVNYIIPDEEQVEGEIYPNACIYACDDLELDGEGTLQITGRADKGINTRDDLTIKGGTWVINSTGVGIRANDSLEVRGGVLTVQSGGDGIKSANIETEGKGHISLTGGELYITARGDGVSAATDLSVTGGKLVITTTDTDGEVLAESSGDTPGRSSRAPGGFMGGGGGFPGGPGESRPDKAAISAKGLKAAGNLTVSGGNITIVTKDDGLHANGNITVENGFLHIRAADDGMHADKELLLAGGVSVVAQSYEGLEALHITVTGGTHRITASDDGANATSGEGGGMGGPGFRPGMGGSGSIDFSEDQPCLTFAGGYTVFNASGDGIDSNGWIKMTGGTVLVFGPTDNGNGPIDFGDGGYNMAISGGTFLAVGSSGMAETAENAGQSVLAAYWNRNGLSAGDIVGVLDAEGRVLAAFKLPKAIASIVYSSPNLTAGGTYTLVSGGSYTGDAIDGVITPAAYSGYESLGEIEAY